MDITGAGKGITGSSPYYGTQNITINNSNLQISSTLGAIYAFGGGIQINDCYIFNPLGATYSYFVTFPVVAEARQGTDTVLKTKLFGLKVRHFNNSCLLIAFTRSIHALFSM